MPAPGPLPFMKTIILVIGLLALSLPALAGIPAGRGELSATLTGTVTHDSNLFGTPDPVADSSLLFVPRLNYTRKSGRIEADANVGISVIRYLDQDQLDADNLDGSVTLRVTEADFRNYSGLLSALYRESSDLNIDVNARLNTRTTVLTARSALITGPKSNVAVSGNYTDTRLDGGSDQQILNTEALYDYKDFLRGNSLRLVASYDELHSSGDNDLGVPINQDSYVLSAGLGRSLYHEKLRAGISYGYRVLNRSAAEAAATGGPLQRSGYVVGASIEGPFLPERRFPKVVSLISLSYQDAATPGIYDTCSSWPRAWATNRSATSSASASRRWKSTASASWTSSTSTKPPASPATPSRPASSAARSCPRVRSAPSGCAVTPAPSHRPSPGRDPSRRHGPRRGARRGV